MTALRFRWSRPTDADPLFRVWASAVDRTHDFLSKPDRTAIEPAVRDYVATANLWVAASAADHAVAFMGMTNDHMDSLFVHADWRGQRIGRAMVRSAIMSRSIVTTDVNEQNGQAIGFYRRLGFETVGRSPTDDEGRPYPLLHLQLERGRWLDGQEARGLT